MAARGRKAAPKPLLRVALEPGLRDAVAQGAVAIRRGVQHAGGRLDLAQHQHLAAIGHARDAARELLCKALLDGGQCQGSQRHPRQPPSTNGRPNGTVHRCDPWH